MKYYLTFFCLQTRHANNAVQRERAGPGGQLQADQQGQVHQVHIIYYEQYTFTFYKPANKIQYIRYILYIIHSTLLHSTSPPTRSSTSDTYYILYTVHFYNMLHQQDQVHQVPTHYTLYTVHFYLLQAYQQGEVYIR